MRLATKCPCGSPVCRHWHVPPAAIQGVSFTVYEARAVAVLLEDPSLLDELETRYRIEHALACPYCGAEGQGGSPAQHVRGCHRDPHYTPSGHQ